MYQNVYIYLNAILYDLNIKVISRRSYFHIHSSLLPMFLSYFIFAVPMRECLGKHSCMSSTFHLAILNSTVLAFFVL